MQIFFSSAIDGNLACFDADETRHAVKALRLKSGDLIHFTDGNGVAYQGHVMHIYKDSMEVEIHSREIKSTGRPYSLHIALSPLKNPDRLEWFIEKAVEIGIDAITPIICQRTEKPTVKKARLEQIVRSAAKQSLKYQFPVIHEPMAFAAFLALPRNGHSIIFHCMDQPKKTLKDLPARDAITLLIGPEGDFSPQEIALAVSHGFEAFSLGEERLRTETAALFACNAFKIISTLAP